MAPCIKVDSCHEEGLEWIAGSFENRVWVPEGDLLLELVSDLVVVRVRMYFFLEDMCLITVGAIQMRRFFIH